MLAIEIILLIVYLLSPVPLLIYGLSQRSRVKQLTEELKFLKQSKQFKIQPDIYNDVPVVAVSETQKDADQPSDGVQNAQTVQSGNPVRIPVPLFMKEPNEPGTAFPKPASEDAVQQPVVPAQPAVQPVTADASQQPVVQPVTADAAQQPVVPAQPAVQPVTVQTLSMPKSPVVQPLNTARQGYSSNAPAGPVQPPYTEPPVHRPYSEQPVHVKPAGNTENSNMVILLVLGVVLLLFASVGFISATWSSLGIAARAVCLLSFSFILLAAGIFARAKLKLNNTSIAFYSIGSIALPITILGSAAFGLLGDFFTMDGPNSYNTILLALWCLFILLGFGALYFESRVFAAGTLCSLSCIIFTVALRYNGSPYRWNVLVIAVFASAAVLLVPLMKKIPGYSVFEPFSGIYELYTVINLYVMSAVAITLCCTGPVNRIAGIFLCVLAAAFLTASFRLKENGLLSLPSMVLFLIGTGLMFRPTAFLPAILWMLTAAACLIAMSFLLKSSPVLSNVFYWCGAMFLILTAFPLFYYALVYNTETPLPLLLTIPLIGGFLFLTKIRKQPHYAAGAILPLFTLLLGGVLHIIASSVTLDTGDEFLDIFPGLPRTTVYLTALIIAAVLYAVFCYIPHHPLYTVLGESILMGMLVIWTYAYMRAFVFLKTYDEELYTPDTAFLVVMVLAFALLLLTLANAFRRDLLNVRDRSVTELPKSILGLRYVYSMIWPLFYALGISVLTAPSEAVVNVVSRAVSGTILIAVCFVCLIVILNLCGPEGLLRPELSEKLTAPRVAAFFVAALTMAVEITVISFGGKYAGSGKDTLYVLAHLLPFLVPAVVFYAYFRFRCTAPNTSPALLLTGLYTATASLWYGMEIFRHFKTAERLGIPAVCLRPELLLSLIMLGLAVYYLLRSERSLKPVSPVFIWVMSLCGLLFLIRIIDPALQTNPVIALSVGITLLVCALIFAGKYYPVSFVPIIFLTILCIHYAVFMMKGHTNFSWLTVLFCQIPVLLFALFAFLQTILKPDAYRRNPFPDYMLLMQSIIFFATPFLTWDASENEAELLQKAGLAQGNLFNSIFESVFMLFTNCFFLAYALPGFVFTGICFFLIYRDDETVKKRVLGIALVIASTLLCMRFPGTRSIAEQIGQFYLLPSLVLMAVLPWIIEDRPEPSDPERTLIGTIRIAYCTGAMALLGVAALVSGNTEDIFFYAVPAVTLILFGYLFQKKYYIRIGVVCMIIFVLYIINRIWGDMAWWIYFGLSGIALITVAVRNEIRKRNK